MALETQLNWQTDEHEPQLKLLEKAIKTKRLAHAYIFSGPAEAEKMAIARKLAEFLLCEQVTGCGDCGNCKTFNAGSNADYLHLFSDDSIKIDSIRELTYKLALKSYNSGYKIAVIDNAHNMTTEAANGLLKVLEEPKPNTIMILITDNVHKLLPTIASRAQKIHFAPPKSVPEISDDEDRRQALSRFFGPSLGDKLVLAAELAEQETMDIKKFLEYSLKKLQENLREAPTPSIVSRIKAVIRAQRLIDQNVNTKLLLSELMVNSN